VAMLTYASVSSHIRAGTLVPLAVTSADRMTALPEVPTLRELGLGDFTSLVWFSLSGPARMPMEIVEAINREANKAMQAPHIREQMARDAIEAKPLTPAEMTRFTQDEIDRWGPLIKRIMAAKE
jgi:tripartite-type tricarboxylate transporter receptor subunit TctC